MTTERQAEVQRSLMTMLGDRRAAASSIAPPKTSQSFGGSTVTFFPSPAAPDGGNNNDIIKPPSPPNLNPPTDFWKCVVCTLNNPSMVEICEACETTRQY